MTVVAAGTPVIIVGAPDIIVGAPDIIGTPDIIVEPPTTILVDMKFLGLRNRIKKEEFLPT